MNLDSYITDKPLLTNYPLQNYENIIIPKLEKMLIDLFCEKYILRAYQDYFQIT